jgi:hypothetical protein
VVWVRAGNPAGGAGVVEHAALVVEHLTDLHAVPGDLIAGRLDVVDDQQELLHRSWCRGRDPGAEDHRARRARRRQLHDPEVRAGGEVGVQPPPELLVEVPGPVHVGDRQHDDLELHVHFRGSLLVSAIAYGLHPRSFLTWSHPGNTLASPWSPSPGKHPGQAPDPWPGIVTGDESHGSPTVAAGPSHTHNLGATMTGYRAFEVTSRQFRLTSR